MSREPYSDVYSPQVIDRWLREWDLLISLSETPATSAHLLSSQCRHSEVGCSSGKPVGIKSTRNVGDPVRYVDLLADIRGAAKLLPAHSLESQVVAKRISTGAWIDQIAAMLNMRADRVRSAYRSACKLMAQSLGWVDVDRDDESC